MVWLRNRMPVVCGAVLALVAIGAVAGKATAAVYAFDRAVGSDVTASGTIRTDGTLGTLAIANILDWNIHVAFSSGAIAGTADFLRASSTLGQSDLQANLMATADALLWDFAGTGSLLIVDDASGSVAWGVCGDAVSPFCSIANSESFFVDLGFGNLGASQPYAAGSFVVAEAIAEPAAAGLFALGLAGLAVVVRRRRWSSEFGIRSPLAASTVSNA